MTVDEERAFYRDYIETLYRQIRQAAERDARPGVLQHRQHSGPPMAEAGSSTRWTGSRRPAIPHQRQVGQLFILSVHPGDQRLRLLSNREADYFAQICKDQFDALYEEGAETGQVMCVSLHPFLIGQPHRPRYFDEILSYVLSFQGVWATTSDEIADYYMANYYDQVKSASPNAIKSEESDD